ncbi:MAG TPA: SPOR domain-containing protein [Pseudothermotoga sp.]
MKRYLVVKHNFTSIFSCNNKVFDYIVNEKESCYTVEYNGKFKVCFGSYNDKERAKARRNTLKNKGIKTVITEKGGL